MNSSHVKGTVKDIKGKAKEEFGHATGNSKTAVKGVGEQVAGKVQKAWGNLRDKVKDSVDKALSEDKPRKSSSNH